MIEKTVLVVEDETSRWDAWKKQLSGKVTLICAASIEEAEEQFAANPGFVAIAMDACVPGDSPTTPPLVKKFRKTFAGPMIAMSGSGSYRQELLRAGCDHEAAKNAWPAKLIEVLGL